jgi:hypothetical protein
MSETVEDVRRDYEEHPDTFVLIRGFARCRFCRKITGGYQKVGHPDKFICIQCLGLYEDQAPKGEIVDVQAPKGEIVDVQVPNGEIVDVKCSGGIKKMQVTVATSATSWDDEFEIIEDYSIQKLYTGFAVTVIRRNYFVQRCNRIRVVIKSLEDETLTLQVSHLNQDLDIDLTKTILFAKDFEYVIIMNREVGEDRESYKFCDSSGKLVMLLSFQEVFEDVHRKRNKRSALPNGHQTQLDISLRRLCLLGQSEHKAFACGAG